VIHLGPLPYVVVAAIVGGCLAYVVTDLAEFRLAPWQLSHRRTVRRCLVPGFLFWWTLFYVSAIRSAMDLFRWEWRAVAFLTWGQVGALVLAWRRGSGCGPGGEARADLPQTAAATNEGLYRSPAGHPRGAVRRGVRCRQPREVGAAPRGCNPSTTAIGCRP